MKNKSCVAMNRLKTALLTYKIMKEMIDCLSSMPHIHK